MVTRHQISPVELGIDLHSKKESQLFRWFLLCLLFGKPIRQIIAQKAYENLLGAGITSINTLANTNWNNLVALLDQAHYVRYDFSTATKLLEIAKKVKADYGTVTGLLTQASSVEDLEVRLAAFRGVGPVTIAIFTREIAAIWFSKSNHHDYESALKVAQILTGHGFDAYIIGGAVRDLWLGREPKDFDLVTNATPEQIMTIPDFSTSNHTDTAQAYGVTRVKLLNHNVVSELEVATFRRDIQAHRGRTKTKIAFADLEDDVMRRDFTINALALDPESNFISDYVGGITDLEQKLITFIGDPAQRITEDPLRIMRAIRFKNQLDFTYHPSTISAIGAAVKAGNIETIATDRLRDELTRLLQHTSRRRAIEDLHTFGILDLVLPEVAAGKGVQQPTEFHAEGDVWQHQLQIMEYLPANSSRRLVWAALLHDIGKGPTSIRPTDPTKRIRFDRHYAVGAEMAKAILRRLRFSNHDIKDITWIIYHHISIDDLPSMRPSRRQRLLGHPAFEDLLELHRCDAAASWRRNSPHGTKPQFRAIERIWHEYQLQPHTVRQPSLKRDLGIDGKWLIEYFKNEYRLSGPIVGRILRKLDEWYRDEGIKNTAAYAIRARELILQYDTSGELVIVTQRQQKHVSPAS